MYSPWLKTLDNGLRSLFWESPFTKIATVQCFFPGGKRLESCQTAGMSRIMAHLFFIDYHDFLEELGSSVTVDVEADYLVISCKCLTEDLADLLQFLGNVLPRIEFNEASLMEVKADFIDRINEQKHSPFYLAHAQIQPFLYDRHPYGLPNLGTIDSLSCLQLKDLQDHYDRYFLPGHLTVTITANSDPDRIGELVAKSFDSWKTERELPPLEHRQVEFRPGLEYCPWEDSQTYLLLGFPAPAAQNQDFFAMKIINAYLGNGSSCQLFQVLREQNGLVYEVSTHCPTRYDRSHLLIYATTDPDLQPKVKDLILQEIDRLQNYTLTPEELELAKSKLLGHYSLAKQTPAQLAYINGWYHTLALPPDFDFRFIQQIEETTAKQIKAVAQKYLSNLALSIVG